MPEDMPGRMPENMPDRMLEDMPDKMPEDMPDKMPEDMSDRMPEDLPVTKRIDVMVGITGSKISNLWFSIVKLPTIGFFLPHLSMILTRV